MKNFLPETYPDTLEQIFANPTAKRIFTAAHRMPYAFIGFLVANRLDRKTVFMLCTLFCVTTAAVDQYTEESFKVHFTIAAAGFMMGMGISCVRQDVILPILSKLKKPTDQKVMISQNQHSLTGSKKNTHYRKPYPKPSQRKMGYKKW